MFRTAVVLLVFTTPCPAQPEGQDRQKWIARVERELSLKSGQEQEVLKGLWPKIRDDKLTYTDMSPVERGYFLDNLSLLMTTNLKKQMLGLADRAGAAGFADNVGLKNQRQRETVRLKFFLKNRIEQRTLLETSLNYKRGNLSEGDKDIIKAHRDLFPEPLDP